MRHEYVVIGAGPCGLAATRELVRSGAHPVLLERAATAGGLASSFRDDGGFVWDQGAHVVFSYHGDFDTLLDDVMAGDVYRHERSSYILYGDRRVPYPFQHNLSALAVDDAVECMVGMIDRPMRTIETYDDWLLVNFGAGVVDRFMRPYHVKVWTVPTTEMSVDWVTHRVATVDWRAVLADLVQGKAAPGWGPNSTFTYPGMGGIGEPFRRLAKRLPDIRYRHRIARIDLGRRTLLLDSGDRLGFDQLITTMPLTKLVDALVECPATIRSAARVLRHNQVLVVGIGATGRVDPSWHWMYFPDPEYPYYRITNMGLFSARNMPEPRDEHVSFLAETALPAGTPWPARDDAVRDTISGLVRSGLLDDPARVVSTYVREVPMAYPIPTLDRTDAVATILEYLERHDVYSRGRFGIWMYEYGNMDHAIKMGTDVARYLLSGEPERIRLPHLHTAEHAAAAY